MIDIEKDYTLDKLFTKYKAALKILLTKLEIINDEIEDNNKYNPIEHIKGRIKTKESI